MTGYLENRLLRRIKSPVSNNTHAKTMACAVRAICFSHGKIVLLDFVRTEPLGKIMLKHSLLFERTVSDEQESLSELLPPLTLTLTVTVVIGVVVSCVVVVCCSTLDLHIF